MQKDVITKKHTLGRYENHRKKTKQKSSHQEPELTTEQIAQLNLIRISDGEFDANDLSIQEDYQQKFSQYPSKVLAKQKRPQIRFKDRHHRSQQIKTNKSTELKINVTDKLTESFKSSLKNAGLQIHTDQVCVLKRKIALNLSNYLIVGDQKNNVDTTDNLNKMNRRPSINCRTYYKHKWRWGNQNPSQTTRDQVSGRTKIHPRLQPLKHRLGYLSRR